MEHSTLMDKNPKLAALIGIIPGIAISIVLKATAFDCLDSMIITANVHNKYLSILYII